jgi:site-specific DNA-methyltransferase (adenine-specific)
MDDEKVDSCIVIVKDTSSEQIDWDKLVGKLKPGSHIVAICPILQQHRVTAAMEDCGVEIRDCVLVLGSPSFMVTLGRVPLEGTVAENVLRYGVGALGIDGCRVGFSSSDDPRIGKNYCHNAASDYSPGVRKNNKNGNSQELYKGNGRWPANCILSKSPSVIGQFPSSVGARSQNNNSSVNIYQGQSFNKSETRLEGFREWYNDSGSAARFFHQVEGDIVSELVKYLVKLINPPGGKVLFLGPTRYDEHQ